MYGEHGTTASSTIVYEIEPGKRLGWHTDATEESCNDVAIGSHALPALRQATTRVKANRAAIGGLQ